MKSPFSPWFGLYVMIGVCGALFVHASFFRHSGGGFGAMLSGTTGIVRAIHEDGGDELSGTHAVVALDDGTVVDGPVAPGCLVLVGDRVNVHAQWTTPSMQKSYLVIPQNLRHKD